MPHVQLRDIVMYYEEAGDGPPLVLVMGLGGDSQAWAGLVPELAKRHRVVTFDNRGAGRTSAPDRPYSVTGMAADTLMLLDRLEIAEASVVGFSLLGGAIAQELAASHADRIGRVALVGAAAAADGYTRNVIRSWVDARRSNMSREQILRLTASWLYSPELLGDEERFRGAITAALANPHEQVDHAFARQAEAAIAFDGSGRLGEIQQPVLVVTAEDDVLVPARCQAELAAGLPNATALTLPGGHAGLFEHPREYLAAIGEFLGAPAAAGAS